jgi:hypothetical protein
VVREAYAEARGFLEGSFVEFGVLRGDYLLDFGGFRGSGLAGVLRVGG